MADKHISCDYDQLKQFAKKIYEEACYGYLDLADSVVENNIQKFLTELEKSQTKSDSSNFFVLDNYSYSTTTFVSTENTLRPFEIR